MISGSLLVPDAVTGGSPLLVILLVVPVFFCQMIVTSRYDWRCGQCGRVFSISPFTACFLPHSFPFRKLTTCPHCGTRSWMDPVRKPPEDRGQSHRPGRPDSPDV